ncbi:MAG: xanthine dehydrogenase family protein subunit M [Nitrososphaerota archaeon]
MSQNKNINLGYINLFNTHIIPVKFNYHAPQTLEEALNLLNKLKDKARVIAGGTDLIVDMKLRRKEPEHVVSLNKIRELDYITVDSLGVKIGAIVKLRKIEKEKIIRERFPALYEALKSMASIQVRNMGTMVGNICNASPAADTAPPLLIYNATLTAKSLNNERKIPIEEFFKAPGKTALKEDELVTEIFIPYPPQDSHSTFLKITRVGMDLSKVSIAVLTKFNGSIIEDIGIAFGAVAPTPLRIRRAEEFLKNKPLTEENLKIVQEIVAKEIKPITDVRSTEWYRREVAKVLVKDALMKCLEEKGGR